LGLDGQDLAVGVVSVFFPAPILALAIRSVQDMRPGTTWARCARLAVVGDLRFLELFGLGRRTTSAKPVDGAVARDGGDLGHRARPGAVVAVGAAPDRDIDLCSTSSACWRSRRIRSVTPKSFALVAS
jgi:hypothetical protein